ncbi:DUF4384 domain-containing protein [Marinithermus hydrothermalis]|uniref:S-layer-like protein n=1 Tax=Marinithermus hydrothermalis (strain DSM 14884 / JCM 11576 / T1) TaxID=869210 RepID=F2NNN9_MARHT|nr:DUF4384 domain-containing protein [Marinithermus hydrothermalis]AEB11054.1 S-layer-like protein [Marinithermus hydrothermalis DSM 14884]
MKRGLALGLFALILSACTVTLRPGDVSLRIEFGLELADVITRFEPTRGPGAVYRVGEPVQFVITLRQAGYVTLVAVDEDGRAEEFERNLFLPAGTHTLPPPGARYRYEVSFPTGVQRVRAIYTSTPAPASVRFRGVFQSDGLNRHTALFIEKSAARLRDVRETFFHIVP